MRFAPARTDGMGARRDLAPRIFGRPRGVDAPYLPDARDHRRQVCRAVSFHRLLLGHLGEDQPRAAGGRAGTLEDLRSRPAGRRISAGVAVLAVAFRMAWQIARAYGERLSCDRRSASP